jgi:hypothetical protein
MASFWPVLVCFASKSERKFIVSRNQNSWLKKTVSQETLYQIVAQELDQETRAIVA